MIIFAPIQPTNPSATDKRGTSRKAFSYRTILIAQNSPRRKAASFFPWRAYFQGKRMDSACEFLGQSIIHRAMALNSAFSNKMRRNYLDAKMCLALVVSPSGMTGMTCMLMRFIDHAQELRREGRGKFALDRFADGLYSRL
jgi:hypothetical protein